jgi:hypothetical protein
MDNAKSLHPHRPLAPTVAILTALLAALLFSAGSLGAAGRVDLSLGFGACDILSYSTRWATGFEAGGFFALWKKGGIHVNAAFLKGSRSDFWYSGIGKLIDAGAWISFGPGSAPSIVFLGASLSYGDIYEVDLGGIGGHFGFRQEYWFSKHLGLYGRGVLRFFAKETEVASVAPSLSGGIAFRF